MKVVSPFFFFTFCKSKLAYIFEIGSSFNIGEIQLALYNLLKEMNFAKPIIVDFNP